MILIYVLPVRKPVTDYVCSSIQKLSVCASVHIVLMYICIILYTFDIQDRTSVLISAILTIFVKISIKFLTEYRPLSRLFQQPQQLQQEKVIMIEYNYKVFSKHIIARHTTGEH